MYTDIEFINRLSFKLDKFRRVDSSLYNFRCPLCGDSTQDKNKARAYFYKSKQRHMRFKCHNCGESATFSYFLKIIDSILYKEYIFSKYKNKRSTSDIAPLAPTAQISSKMKKFKHKNKSNIFESLERISDLPVGHPAKEYILSRMIPAAYHKTLYYAPEFCKFTNTLIPNKFKSLNYDNGRIIIPFIDKDNNIIGYQGRSYDISIDKRFKYITIVLDKDALRVYGADSIDVKHDVIIVEGPFDSMFLNNSIAVAGSDMNVDIGDIFMLDCENRNPHIIKKMKSLINKRKKVVILDPVKYAGMDINDMILSGMSAADILKLINSNIYSGTTALLKLNIWARI